MPDQADVLRDELALLRPPGAPDAGEPLSALCISGGGIRSATFGLGVLQGLAEQQLLPRFDYLSTVSGGGFIGSWLTAWASRAGGIEAVAAQLQPEPARRPPRAGGPDPVHHLRAYSNYLTPRAGTFTTDTWTLVAAVARNIVLNWCVLVPLLLAVLMIPRLYLSILALPERVLPPAPGGVPDYGNPVFDAISGSFLVAWVLPLVCMLLLATALANTLRFLPGVGGRANDRTTYTREVLAPLLAAVLAYLLFDSLFYLGSRFTTESALAAVLGAALVTCGIAWTLFLVQRRRSRARVERIAGPLSLAIAAMAVGGGVASWIVTNRLLWSPNPAHAPSWAMYATFGPPLVLLGYCAGTVLFVGLSSRVLHDDDREWMSRAVAAPLLACVAWTALGAAVLLLPDVVLGWGRWAHGAALVATGAAAWLTRISESWRASRARHGVRSRRDAALGLALAVAPFAFLMLFSVGLSVATDAVLGALQGLDWRDHDAVLWRTPVSLLAAATLLLVAISWVMGRYVNINTFSLHGLYRDRLVRAYLGASNPDRRPNPFTGFDPHDDLRMTALERTRPFHVLNLTLDLVRTRHLAWQERLAASFVVTPLCAGSADLGYRPVRDYAGGMSLGTAMAISGAVASPAMACRATVLGGFILTLFDVRQGVWLGNTGPAGDRTWREPSPRSAVRLILREALGLTSDRSEYAYLSDGGHFDNLGLYEMVRRRCRRIVVLDAGCDPDFLFEDLGNALRKIRIDFGISIDFDDAEQFAELRARRRRFAMATIRYRDVDATAENGRLLYIKPVLLGDEPPDVRSYAAAHPTFPHEATANQWFTESQLESYRALGLHTLRAVANSGALTNLFPPPAPAADDAKLRITPGAPPERALV